jgi:TetR/AcrR family transcriptional repressor of nem operon
MRRTSDARVRLLGSIAGLVHARGYAAVGVDAICRRAGVKKGSFYYFFRSKQHLMLAALEHRWHEVEAKLLAAACAKDVPPVRRIGRLFDLAAAAEVVAKRRGGHVLGCPFGNLSAEMSGSDERVRRKVDQVFRRLTHTLELTLREAVAAGELPPDTAAAATAQALVAYFEGVRLVARTRNNPRVIKALGRHAVQLAWQRTHPR